MKKIYMFDADGVLVDSTHRYKTRFDEQGRELIDLEHWRAMEHACYFDKALPHAETLRELLKDSSAYVVIATARQMNTADFLSLEMILGCKPHGWIYRRAGDTRSGGLLKVLGLRKLLSLKQFKGASLEVFEDNINYLKTICDSFKGRAIGHYVPSNQGH